MNELPASTALLLNKMRHGDQNAAAELVTIFYNELRRIASCQIRSFPVEQTLSPTAVVHEALLKLTSPSALQHESPEDSLRNPKDFKCLVAFLMRQVLLEHARAKHTDKRRHIKVELTEAHFLTDSDLKQFEELTEALDRLQELDPLQRSLIDLHFFHGYTLSETARHLGIGKTKVVDELKFARVWLRRQLDRSAIEGNQAQ